MGANPIVNGGLPIWKITLREKCNNHELHQGYSEFEVFET